MKGTEGTVTAYNYTRQGDVYCERSLFNHGHYTRDTLFEGNDVDCEMLLADKCYGFLEQKSALQPCLTASENTHLVMQILKSQKRT